MSIATPHNPNRGTPTKREATGPPDARLQAAESVGVGLARLVHEQADAAIAIIDRRHPDRQQDVHDVRVAIKRLRAYLRLIKPFLNATLFRRETGRLRTAARNLAPWRDALVARETLARMAEIVTNERDRQAFDRALVSAQGAKLAVISSREQEEALRQSQRAFEQVTKSFSHLTLPESGWLAIRPGLQKVYQQNSRWMRRALDQGEDDAFHEWRKQAKYLSYQLQILIPAAPRRLGRMIKRLKKLQEILGNDHDLVMLDHLLHSHPVKFGGAKAVQRMAICLDKQRACLRKKARTVGQRLYDDKPKRFARKLQRFWDKWVVVRDP